MTASALEAFAGMERKLLQVRIERTFFALQPFACRIEPGKPPKMAGSRRQGDIQVREETSSNDAAAKAVLRQYPSARSLGLGIFKETFGEKAFKVRSNVGTSFQQQRRLPY